MEGCIGSLQSEAAWIEMKMKINIMVTSPFESTANFWRGCMWRTGTHAYLINGNQEEMAHWFVIKDLKFTH